MKLSKAQGRMLRSVQLSGTFVGATNTMHSLQRYRLMELVRNKWIITKAGFYALHTGVTPPLCKTCHGLGTVPYNIGQQQCPRCRGTCYEPRK